MFSIFRALHICKTFSQLHIDLQALAAASLVYGQPMSSVSIQQQVLLDSGSPGTTQSLLGMKRGYHDSQ